MRKWPAIATLAMVLLLSLAPSTASQDAGVGVIGSSVLSCVEVYSKVYDIHVIDGSTIVYSLEGRHLFGLASGNSTLWESNDLGSTIYRVAYSSSYELVAGISFEDGRLEVRDLEGNLVYSHDYDMFGTSVLFVDNLLLVGLQDGYAPSGKIVALRVGSWDNEWELDVPGGVWDMTTAGNLVAASLGLVGTDYERMATIILIDPGEGRIRSSLDLDADDPYSIDYSGDGGLLAVGADHYIAILDASQGSLRLVSEAGAGGDVVGITWSPDGERLAVG